MANRYWIGTGSDVSAAANWGGSAPVDSDSAFILKATEAITTNLAQSSIDLVDLTIGKDVTASIGSPTVPLYYGVMTGKVVIDAPRCPSINFRCTSVPTLIVKNAGNDNYAFHLYGGTVTTMIVNKAGRVVIGANATVTTLVIGNSGDIMNDVVIEIEEGATVGTIIQNGGQANCKATVTTVKVNAGIHTNNGVGAGAVTTLDVGPYGKYIFNADGKTITTANIYGVLDARQDPKVKTVTTANLYGGGQLLFENGVGTVAVGTLNGYGGFYDAVASSMNVIVPPSIGVIRAS